MTQEVINRVGHPNAQLLDFIRYTLAADLARQSIGQIDVDVERLFSSVDLLADRFAQPWSPFVAAWSAGLESFAPAPRLVSLSFADEVNKFGRSVDAALMSVQGLPAGAVALGQGAGQTIATALRNVVTEALLLAQPGEISNVLSDAREEMLDSLFDILELADAAQVEYLSPLLELAARQESARSRHSIPTSPSNS